MIVNMKALKELLEKTGTTYEIVEMDLFGELENFMDAAIKPGWVQLARGATEEGKYIVCYVLD